MAPLWQITAANLAKEITNRVIYSLTESPQRHECPHQLLSDNGTQFASYQLQALLAAFRIVPNLVGVRVPLQSGEMGEPDLKD